MIKDKKITTSNLSSAIPTSNFIKGPGLINRQTINSDTEADTENTENIFVSKINNLVESYEEDLLKYEIINEHNKKHFTELNNKISLLEEENLLLHNNKTSEKELKKKTFKSLNDKANLIGKRMSVERRTELVERYKNTIGDMKDKKCVFEIDIFQ